ncbi:MAG: hypothetical protein ACXVLX_17735, partial [Ilumatobacteraceae bacterium]
MQTRPREEQGFANRVGDLDQLTDASRVARLQRSSPAIQHVTFQVSKCIVRVDRSDRAQPMARSTSPCASGSRAKT